MPPGRTAGGYSGAPAYYEEELPPPPPPDNYIPGSTYVPPADAAPPPLPPADGGYATEPQGGNDVLYTYDSPTPPGPYRVQDPAATAEPYQALPPPTAQPQYGELLHQPWADPNLPGSGASAPLFGTSPQSSSQPVGQAGRYNWGAAEPYGMSERAIPAQGNALASQSAYGPPVNSSELTQRPAGSALTPPAGSNLLADYYNGAAQHARSMKVSPKPRKWTKGDYEIAGRMLLGMGGGMMGRGAPNGIQGPYGPGVAGQQPATPVDMSYVASQLGSSVWDVPGSTQSESTPITGRRVANPDISIMRPSTSPTPTGPADLNYVAAQLGGSIWDIPGASSAPEGTVPPLPPASPRSRDSSWLPGDYRGLDGTRNRNPLGGPADLLDSELVALGWDPNEPFVSNPNATTLGYEVGRRDRLANPPGSDLTSQIDQAFDATGTITVNEPGGIGDVANAASTGPAIPSSTTANPSRTGRWGMPANWRDGNLATPTIPSRGTQRIVQDGSVPRDNTPESVNGYGAMVLRQRELANPEMYGEPSIGPDGRFTAQGIANLQELGWLDANGLWDAPAAQAGAIPPEAVGRPGDAVWLRNPDTWAESQQSASPEAPATSDAGQPLDPNAVLPVTPAEVAAVEGTASSGNTWNSSSGGGRSGRSRSSSGGGGSWSGGGSSRSSSSSRRSRRGGMTMDDMGDWESFLDDFDGDGDIDDKDIRKAKMRASKRKRTRRGKRGGRSTVNYQSTPMREQILGEIEKSRNKDR